MLPLEFALTLSGGGFHLIPLRKYTTGQDAACKQAAYKNWPKAAKPTEEQIAEWGERNYGVLCGKDDLVVIDADSRESCSWVNENLPPTPVKVKTIRGYHFYYRCTQKLRDKKSANTSLPMDVKATGYVVGPGCMRVDEIGQPFVGYQLTSQEEPSVENLPYLEDEDITKLGGAFKQNIGENYLEVHGYNPFECTALETPPVYDYCFQAEEGNRYEGCRGVLHFAIHVDELPYDQVRDRLFEWDKKNGKPWGKRNLKYQLDWYWAKSKRFIETDGYGERHRPKPTIIITPKEEQKRWDLPQLCQVIPGILQEYVEHYMRTAPIPHLDMAIFSAIGFGSVIASRRYSTTTGAYSSLFLCTVAGTGCGKNHSQVLTKKLLNEADCDHLVGPSGYRSAGGLLSTLKEFPNHISFIDEFGDEISGLKGRRNPVALALWAAIRTLYSSAADIYSPASYSREGKSGKGVDDYVRIYNPGITIFGLTTQSQLMNALSSAEVENGTINRFIFNINEAPRDKPSMAQLMGAQISLPNTLVRWTRETGGQREETSETKEDGEGNKILREISRASFSPADPVIVSYSNEAKILIDESPDLESREELFARYMENAHRIMLILAVSCNPAAPIVTTKHVRWAFTYLRHLYLRFAHVFGTQHANTEHEERLNFALNVIRKEGVDTNGKPEGGSYGLSKSRWRARLKRYSPKDQELLIFQLLRDGVVLFGKEPGRSRKARFYIRELVTAEFYIEEDEPSIIAAV